MLNQELHSKIVRRVEPGRFGRALAGLQDGWGWRIEKRQDGLVEGFVSAERGKTYRVHLSLAGQRSTARCSCPDYNSRGVVCKHLAFAAMHELAAAARARSAHKELPLI